MVALAQVVDLLGLAVVTGPLVGDVRAVCVYDPQDLVPGSLLLGINVHAAEAVEVVQRAAGAGACALVLRADSAAAGEGAAARWGLPLLTTEVSWERVRSEAQQVLAPAEEDESPIRDLFALANAIAGMMGGAVAIEDPQSNLLAYSNLGHPIDEAREQTILARRNPDAWAARMAEVGIAQQLMAAHDGAVRVVDPLGKARARVAILVRAGVEVLGSIWVVQGDAALGPEAETTLQDATPLAALHLLRHRAISDVSRRRQGALLRGLLDGAGPVRELRLEDGPCVVVAFALDGSLKRDLAIDLITVACDVFRRRVVCSWDDSTVYALFPALRSTDGLRSLIAEICTRASDVLGAPVRAGLGAVVPSLSEAPVSRAVADRAVRVVVASGQQVASLEEVRVSSNLLEITDFLRSRTDLRLPVLATIAADDADQAKGYVETLRAFIEASGDVALAAERMHVHKNTVRYRLKRLHEIYGLDLLDPAQYLLVSLELRLG